MVTDRTGQEQGGEAHMTEEWQQEWGTARGRDWALDPQPPGFQSQLHLGAWLWEHSLTLCKFPSQMEIKMPSAWWYQGSGGLISLKVQDEYLTHVT